jgi:sugar lactone lactonase YvrE
MAAAADAPNARSLELVLDGLGFGEGPRWHDDRLWFSDFVLQLVLSVGEDGQARVELELDDRPSGLGWLPDGRLLVVSMHRRAVLRRENDGSVVTHADLAGIATGDTNDMVVSADGTAYVGNFGSDLLGGEPLKPAQLAIVRPDGTATAAADPLMFPNGSVITADGATLIVGETLAAQYRAFAIRDDGSLGESRIWAEVPNRSPDGCVLDTEGAIWFADASRGEVARVREGGEITDVIATPDHAYACTLGGADGRQLFVLTCPGPPMPDLPAGSGRLWTVRVDVPHAGRP